MIDYIIQAIKTLTNRVRALETIQEGNGFVPYLFQSHYGDNAMTSHDKHTVRPIGVGESAWIQIVMPRKVANLSVAELRYIPTGTGTWDYTIETAGGACGEDESNHTDSITDDGEAVTDDEIECLDITDALTPYTAGDSVGVKVTCDALDTTTAINILEIRLR